ncbi:polysaccharide deacetylase family protein [Verrucomicrobiaceae bacterium R5-34]|uniref:Polysaccharide deacetylase family protein n=1 Tax=Oceaniferula flava TaxID=2800421 RepID=A0AAE2SDK9_9BACT|nr:polysaccharide deacetylase family protein [Oceaniferula flavus]MBK1831411.1 polysaccharide deacetylase family protein [Verrucomicrobiaceae bacterium R5-34]MBK1854919.1 polysaccharide deacetylase family protein [Oceaniferula flavus]MBM1136225.1 polysaccharide deacetylase family protein [Oceaniferula flavus]
MIAGNLVRLAVLIALYAWGIWLISTGAVWQGLLLHLCLVGPLLWGTLNPNSRLFGPLQRTVSDDRIWLTLDDGPDPVDTPAILELLENHGVKATFFVIGEKADRYPELIRRIVAEGHQLGNHTYSHPQGKFWSLGPWRTLREIRRCQESLRSITGEAPEIFRAPVGHHNVFVHPVLRAFGMRLVGWTSRGLDGVEKDASIVIRRLHQTMAPGSIVLAHESTPIAAEVVAAILEHAEAKGWEFTSPAAPSSAQPR